MAKNRHIILLWAIVLVSIWLGQKYSFAAEQRFALVVGNDEYKVGRLVTPGNDAGLVANSLQSAGFTVTGARNLDQQTLREAFREFLGQVAGAGPDAVALVYLAGSGLQFSGDNYFVPVDADIARDVDVPLQAVRISDFAQPLAALPARIKIVILDAAKPNPFAHGGDPLAGGLALVDAPPGMAIAFNAAPGTVGPDEAGPYGAYATSFSEMIATGGLSLDDLFTRIRLRVSELTNGAEVPWYVSQVGAPFFMTERAPDAPPAPNAVPLADLRARAVRNYDSVEDAYAAVLALDSMEGYEEFLSTYPDSPFSRRIAAMLAARREALFWHRAVVDRIPPAYWSYLRRYPHGPHAWDARRCLAMLGAPYDMPPAFTPIDFGVPPPPPAELVLVDRPVMIFVGPDYAPPPPPPPLFLPPRPREFGALPPPPPPRERFVLPVPAMVPGVIAVRPPRNVFVPPPPPGGPGIHGAVPASLPSALQNPHHPGALGVHPPGAIPPPLVAIKPAVPPPPPPLVAIKPAAPPPLPPPPLPATVHPAPPPAPPHPAPLPATVHPAPPPPPPHPAPPPTPAVVHPAPPPPPPHPVPPPTPAVVHPAPPPPPPQHPSCPPGKVSAEVNGRPVCK